MTSRRVQACDRFLFQEMGNTAGNGSRVQVHVIDFSRIRSTFMPSRTNRTKSTSCRCLWQVWEGYESVRKEVREPERGDSKYATEKERTEITMHRFKAIERIDMGMSGKRCTQNRLQREILKARMMLLAGEQEKSKFNTLI